MIRDVKPKPAQENVILNQKTENSTNALYMLGLLPSSGDHEETQPAATNNATFKYHSSLDLLHFTRDNNRVFFFFSPLCDREILFLF